MLNRWSKGAQSKLIACMRACVHIPENTNVGNDIAFDNTVLDRASVKHQALVGS